MARSLMARAGGYLGDAVRGARQAPVEVVATLVVAATFSRALQSDTPDAAVLAWGKIAVPGALLLVVAWTGTLLHAMGRWGAVRRWGFTAAGALVVGIYGWTLLDFRFEAEAWRAALLLGAAAVWLVALPAFGGRGDTGEERIRRMRRVDGRFALRVMGAVLYGAALYAGLALALAAVDNLFELKLEGTIYAQVWGCIGFVLIPWIVLGGLEDYVRIPAEPDLTAGPGVASVAQRVALWLVPPLLALYGLILYAYVVRILATGEVPKNLVSPVVLVAGGLAALALLLFDPRPGRGGFARGLRLAPTLFIPLAPLAYWALLARIDQYGWTEFRVVRLVVLSTLVALAIGATIQLARRRAFSLHVAPVVLMVVLLLSALGPWSALAVSRRSQQARLERALTQVGITPDLVARAGKATELAKQGEATVAGSTAANGPGADSSHVVPAAAYEQIRESARYLAGHFGRDALPAGLAGFAGEQPAGVDYAARLGLRPDALPAREGLTIGGTLSRSAPLELGGGLAYRVYWTSVPIGEAEVAPGDRRAVGVALREGRRLELSVGSRLLSADLGPLMRELERTADPRGPGQLPPEYARVSLADAAGDRAGDLVVWSLRAHADSSGWRLQRLEALAVVSRR